MTASVAEVAGWIRSARSTVALTGAGMSTESGIPDFRGPDGVWTRDPRAERLSNIGYYVADAAVRRESWVRRLEHPAWGAEPNAAHRALAALEAAGRLELLVTQNIDGLHQIAGSKHVVELHGHLRTASCLECGHQTTLDEVWPLAEQGQVARCETCGGLMKPDVILFGEPLPYDALRAAQEAALFCDVLISIGTSLEVEPASDLPHLARRSGSRVIIINRQPTIADKIADVTIHDDVATVLPAIVRALRS